jgi:hypothetical protein
VPSTAPAGRAQRVLAVMAFTVIGVSALAIVVLLVCQAVGVPASTFTTGPLKVLGVLPLPGLALGLLLVIASVVVAVAARVRAGRD